MKRQKAPVSELPHYDRLDELVNDVGHCAGSIVSLTAVLAQHNQGTELGQVLANISHNLHNATSRMHDDAQRDFARSFAGHGLIGYAIHKRIEILKAIDLDGDQRDNIRTLNKRLSRFNFEPFKDPDRRNAFDELCRKAVQYCQQIALTTSDQEVSYYDPYGQAAYYVPAETGFYSTHREYRQDYVQLTYMTHGHDPERACKVSVQAFYSGHVICRVYHPEEKTWINNYSDWLIPGMLSGLQEEFKKFEQIALGNDIVDSNEFDLNEAFAKIEHLMIETINVAKKRPDFMTPEAGVWLPNHLAVTPKCYHIPATGRFGLFVAESNYPKQAIALRLCDTTGDVRIDASHAISNIHKRMILNTVGRLINLSLKRNYYVAPSYRYSGN